MKLDSVTSYIKRRLNLSNSLPRYASDETRQYYENLAPTISDYIEKRFKPQLEWYERKAKDNILRFRVIRISIIILSLVISIVNAIGLTSNAATKGIQLFTVIISVIILGFTSFQQLTKSQEDWIPFRATAERLKSEYQLFMHNTKPYSDLSINDETSKARLFIQRVENIYLTEGSEFTLQHKQLIDKSSINTTTDNS
jgi:hypothetical protein